jgi:transposase InsO family protein
MTRQQIISTRRFTIRNTWLARYPLPQHCVYDQGGEFIALPFQQVLLCHQIAGHPTTAKKPQTNSVCERMHQSIGNSLRVYLHYNNRHKE